jgi:DNA-directed RNA polymerase specialized sigma24 family protein
MARKTRSEEGPADPLGSVGRQERDTARDFTEKLDAMLAKAKAGTAEEQARFLADLFDAVSTVIDKLADGVTERHRVDLLKGPAEWRHLDAEAFDWVLERYCHAKTLCLTLVVLAQVIGDELREDQPDWGPVIRLVWPTYTEIGARGCWVWRALARTDAGRTRALAKLAASTRGRLSKRNQRLARALRQYSSFSRGLVSEVPSAVAAVGDDVFAAPSSGVLVADQPRNALKPFLVNLRNAVARQIERTGARDGQQVSDIDAIVSHSPIGFPAVPVDCDEASELQQGLPGCTPRERQVAELLAQGMRPVDVARKLNVRRQTVNTFIRRIRAKLEPPA